MRALELAKKRGAKIFGVVGRDGGFTKKVGDHMVVIRTVDPLKMTAEVFNTHRQVPRHRSEARMQSYASTSWRTLRCKFIPVK